MTSSFTDVEVELFPLGLTHLIGFPSTFTNTPASNISASAIVVCKLILSSGLTSYTLVK